MPAKTNKVPALDDMLCFAVHSTGFAFSQVYRQPLKQLGITYPQYLVMIALWYADNVTVGQLGEQLALETGTLTPLLKRLEAIGLLKRRRSDEDERRVIVSLTEKGRALKKEASYVTSCIEESTGFSIAKIEKLARDVLMLRDNLRRAALSRET